MEEFRIEQAINRYFEEWMQGNEQDLKEQFLADKCEEFEEFCKFEFHEENGRVI